MMLQRTILDVLVRGHAAYRAAGFDLYRDLFGRLFCLDDAEVMAITRYFSDQKVRILQGFPRDELDSRPACYIFLQGESQPDFALNSYGGSGAAPVTPAAAGAYIPGVPQQAAAPAAVGSAAFILSSLWTHQYQILGLARGSPEPVMWLTELNKSILLAARNYFLSRAMQSVTLAASDVQFREDLAPADLYARAITLQCGREFSQADTSKALQQAFRLDGLVGPDGSDSHPPGRPVNRIVPLNPRVPKA